MNFNFDQNRWDRIKTNWGLFWTDQLDRPLISVQLNGCSTNRNAPEMPYKDITAHYDPSVSPEQIVDGWDYNLSCTDFLGDAFPSIFPNFGPGVVAEFLGAISKNGNDTVWFHPKKELSIDELDLELDLKHFKLTRISEIVNAALKKWQGSVQINMTDLGGNLDILSTFLPGEKLLFALYDNPTKVKELVSKIDKIWKVYYDYFNKILMPTNQGYSCWAKMLCDKPYYMLQCDFCYMIGPDMFNEFVKPALEREVDCLAHSFYHLDGPGQLVHLDSLLSIEKLDGIQWVPGPVEKTLDDFADIYNKILDAGKKIQVIKCGSIGVLDRLFDNLNTLKGVQVNLNLPYENKDNIIKWLEQYNVEA